MKRIILGFMALSAASLCLYSCKKTEGAKPESSANTQANLSNLHGMGLNAMQPSDWAGVPAFSINLLKNRLQTDGIAFTSADTNRSYLLVTPQIRDQGQIGSCTGFCGAETDRILYYYKNTSNPPVLNSLTTANGADKAWKNEIPNTSDDSPYTSASDALSPLFLYFVERTVINHAPIGNDPGANMVNICQALQAGSGTGLAYNSYTFDGITNEGNYPYPLVYGSGGYNVATTSNGYYKTYPYAMPAFTGLTTIPGTPNNYPISAQGSSSTTSSGTSTSGYYVITDTKTTLVNDVKAALLANKPVMMGFNVYDKPYAYPYFENLNTTNYTYNPLNSTGTSLAKGVKLMGGHAVPIVGFINDSSQPGGGVFICQNSWGTPWGYHGYFYLPYSVVQNTSVVPAGSLYVMFL